MIVGDGPAESTGYSVGFGRVGVHGRVFLQATGRIGCLCFFLRCAFTIPLLLLHLSERYAQHASRGRHSIRPCRGLWRWFHPTLLRHSFIHFTTFGGSGCLPPLLAFMLCNANATGWVMPNLLFWVICCVSCIKESESRLAASTLGFLPDH